MASFHGSKGVFKVDDSGGTLRDISAYVDSVDFPQNVDMAETTGEGGTTAKTFIPGVREGKISVKGTWDNTASVGSETVLGALANAGGQLAAGGSVSFEYNPAGTATGTTKYTGECYMTSYQQSSPVNGRVGFSADFQVTGAITRATN